jgi:hypothetical protein
MLPQERNEKQRRVDVDGGGGWAGGGRRCYIHNGITKNPGVATKDDNAPVTKRSGRRRKKKMESGEGVVFLFFPRFEGPACMAHEDETPPAISAQ